MSPTTAIDLTFREPAFGRGKRELPDTRRQPALPHVVVVALAYLWAIWFTNAHYMADSGGYVVSILAYDGVDEYVLENPLVRDYRSENPFWDFGHLFWRPVGLLLFKTIGPLASLVVGQAPNLNVLVSLLTLNLIAGLACVLLVHALIRRISGRLWLATLVTIGFIFSHAFLNFAQTGSAYITGLALVLAGVYVLVLAPDGSSRKRALVAGLAFSCAVWAWLLYVLIIPAAIAAPLIIGGLDRSRVRLVYRTALSFALLTGAAYAGVMLLQGIHTPDDLRAWMAAASHGVSTSGITRALFGFPRSLINMGGEGIMFKRYLLQDPFSPVSGSDLLTLGVWKLALFYLACASVLIALGRSRQWRLLALLVMSTAPLALFAVLYDGGAVERYLPIHPVVFAALSGCLAAGAVPRSMKLAPVALIVVLIVTNISAMSATRLSGQQERTAARIKELLPELRPESNLITSHLQDDLVLFQAGFPFHPFNRQRYHLYALVAPNTAHVPAWRELFASRVMAVWRKDGDIWISTRLFQPVPRPEWKWVEGDDPRVSWKDLHAFFAQLHTDAIIGGDDGFARLARSESNTRRLTSSAGNGPVAIAHTPPPTADAR